MTGLSVALHAPVFGQVGKIGAEAENALRAAPVSIVARCMEASRTVKQGQQIERDPLLIALLRSGRSIKMIEAWIEDRDNLTQIDVRELRSERKIRLLKASVSQSGHPWMQNTPLVPKHEGGGELSWFGARSASEDDIASTCAPLGS